MRVLVICVFPLILAGCLSNHCEVYPLHCFADTTTDDTTSEILETGTSDAAGDTTDDTTGDTTDDTTGDTTDEAATTDTTTDGDYCGNGVIDDGEQCDGGNLGGFSCMDLGYSGGILSCDPVTCTYDASSCEAGSEGGETT
jgi:hypothetical protein